jgi:ketosteroid isomerase-like protein
MPSENLELVQSVYADWERGDFSRTAEWADPAIEWARFGGEGAGAWTGLDAMSEAVEEILGSTGPIRAQAERYHDIDEERVLVLTRWTSTADDAEPETELLRANLFRVRGGKVVRLIFYWDRARAFTDLGLPMDTGAGEE